VADKSNQLIQSALSRAAAEPNGAVLHGGKSSPGLFPNTPLGKQTAQRCVQDGYLRPLNSDTSTAYVITEKGLSFLLQQASPRQVLEDLVRVLEARQAQTSELLHVAGQMRAGITQLKATVERVLQQVPTTESLTASLQMPTYETGDVRFSENGAACSVTPDDQAMFQRDILAHLTRWHDSGASEDCPLPELFCQMETAVPGLTIGRFHDALRALYDADRIYLHPWTGPLYDLPEPAFALLVGHLIAYYASGRTTEAATETVGTAHLLRFPVK